MFASCYIIKKYQYLLSKSGENKKLPLNVLKRLNKRKTVDLFSN